MIKKLFVFGIALNFFATSYSQGQFGVSIETNATLLKTNDLYDVESGIGYGIGLTSLASLYQSADWLLEISYTNHKLSAKGYNDYYQKLVDFGDTKFSISNVNINFIINQYIIMPEVDIFHIGVQAGLGTNVFNEWTTKNNDTNFFYDRTKKFNYIYIFGVSGGTEQLRVTIRYNGALTNVFKSVYVHENHNLGDDSVESREFEGRLNHLSFSFTYFFNLFE